MKIFTDSSTVVVAKFPDLTRARVALERLNRRGVRAEEVSLISSGDFYPEKDFHVAHSSHLDNGTAAVEKGAASGAAVAGTGGALLGLGTVLVPGAGPLYVAGAVLLGAITGISMGALAGGAIGVLVDLGFSKEQAEDLSSGMADGQFLILVDTSSLPETEINEVLRQFQPISLMSKTPA